jgi:catechol 2,3-dioxygenase-like lactoylglutathione lyase family enzyme
MFKILGLRSWNLNADDFDAMTAFYRDKLGMEESGRQAIGGAQVVRLRAGTQGIGLFDSSEGARPGIPHHTFACEGPADPEAMRKELEARGIAVDSIRQGREGAGYSVYVVDPGGNRLELSVQPN